jgi:hypothetical protein
MPKPTVKLIPHSPKEFDDASDLSSWLVTSLKSDGGAYYVTSPIGYRAIPAGSVCLLMKDKKIVGEGIIKDTYTDYKGKLASPVTHKPYQGIITFEPSSIRQYAQPMELSFAAKIIGRKLTPHFIQNLGWDDYGQLLAEVVKNGFY